MYSKDCCRPSIPSYRKCRSLRSSRYSRLQTVSKRFALLTDIRRSQFKSSPETSLS